jgi:hypothetical protein
VAHFEEFEVVGGEGAGGEKGGKKEEDGKERGKRWKEIKNKIWVEKGKWGNRGLSEC